MPVVPKTLFKVEEGEHAGYYKFTVAKFFNPVTKEVIAAQDALRQAEALTLLVKRQSGVIEFVKPLEDQKA